VDFVECVGKNKWVPLVTGSFSCFAMVVVTKMVTVLPRIHSGKCFQYSFPLSYSPSRRPRFYTATYDPEGQ
jgi:hypothetical protein